VDQKKQHKYRCRYAQKVVQRQRRSWRRCEAEGRGSVQALQSTVAERLRLCLKTSCGSDPTTSCCTSRRSSRSVEIHRRLEEGSMSTCMKCLSRHSGSRLQVDLARLYIITTVIYRQRTLSIEMLTSDSSTAGDVNRRMLRNQLPDLFRQPYQSCLDSPPLTCTCLPISLIIPALTIRLSWLPVSFLLHVKYPLSYRIHHSFTLTSGSNLPFQQILSTLDFFYLLDCLHDNGTGPGTYHAHHLYF